MARSVPQGKSEFSCDKNKVIMNRIGFASRSHSVTAVAWRGLGPRGSELCVSDNGATNHITDDRHNKYGWVAIPPGKEKVLIGDG